MADKNKASAQRRSQDRTADESGTEPVEKTRVIQRKEVVVTFPIVKTPKWLQGFTDFIREQGVVGLAVGLVLGTQVKSLVDSLVASFVNPLIGLFLPGSGDLATKKFYLSLRGPGNGQDFRYGSFLAQLISFAITAAIIYLTVKKLKLDRLDKKKGE